MIKSDKDIKRKYSANETSLDFIDRQRKYDVLQKEFPPELNKDVFYYDLPIHEAISPERLLKKDENEINEDGIDMYSKLKFLDKFELENILVKNKLSSKEIAKRIDWKKLSNYIDINGWNEFANFLNNDNAIERMTVPGFLSTKPKKRSTRDRPKSILIGDQDEALKMYKINQKVDIEIIKVLKNGNYSVLINNKHDGFIKRHNIHFDIELNEYHTGYITDINQKGRIEIMFEKPQFWNRICECQYRILHTLRYCNGSMNINDDADSIIISKVFQMSKKNFKIALGMLFKAEVIYITKDKINPCITLKKWNYNVLDGVSKAIQNDKNNPIWQFGMFAPEYHHILPDLVKQRNERHFTKVDKKMRIRGPWKKIRNKHGKLIET